MPIELKPYYNRCNELTIQSNCLMWGIRVVVPQRFRRKVLDKLHTSHFGITKMKQLARGYIWWPAIDQDIEKLAKSCQACMSVKNSPPSSLLSSWVWPAKPWQRVHVDFAGLLFGKTYLVLIDAHSKWPEIWEIFFVFGLPEQVVTDNGSQFVSEEFSTFLRNNGIRHFKSTPYHPSTNGAAERLVQTFKNAIKKGKQDG